MINDDKFKKKSIESYCRLKTVCSVFRFFHTSVKKKETLKADSLNNLHIELLIQRNQRFYCEGHRSKRCSSHVYLIQRKIAKF